MGRSPSFAKGLKKGPWTAEEDRKLVAYIEEHGHGSWRALPVKAGLERCGKSCRLRWTNYLRPDIKRGKFSLQEEQTIIQLHALLGNRWSAIANHLPKRTDNEIKNYWNTHLKRRLTKMGIDPITHKSRTAANTTLSHMTQWENARLEAEARLVRGSRVVSERNYFHKRPLCLDVLKAWQGITLSKLTNLSRLENFKNQTMEVEQSVLKDMTEDIQTNTLSISQGLSNVVDIPNIVQGSDHNGSLQVSEMIYQEGKYLPEVFTNSLVNDVNIINNGNLQYGDFEDDNNYWSNILEKLGNDTSIF